MAVIRFDSDKEEVVVIVEKTDLIDVKENNMTYVKTGDDYRVGYMFINESIPLCMVRGERK